MIDQHELYVIMCKFWTQFLKIIFVQKIMKNIFLRETPQKNCCHQSFSFLIQICTKSFVGWGFAPDHTGELTALPQTL